MRIGRNPNKDQQLPDSHYEHQVIIPVYLPNEEGYFKDGFQILQICLNSLLKTTHSNTFITIVNNGSSKKVIDYLNTQLEEKKIHEVIHTTNIGKINAILKGLVGHKFPLVTISDADVLFLNNWQQATYAIFDAFPKAGVVCTTPSPKSFKYINYNIFFENFFSNNLRFKKVKNVPALNKFAASIENPNFYNACQLKNILTLQKKETVAVVGAGHFVATYRREVFENLTIENNSFKLGGNSETKILDIPVIKRGLWRLSTYDNYTYHLGNVVEEWMKFELKNLKVEPFKNTNKIVLPKVRKPCKLYLYFVNNFFARLFNSKPFYKWFLKHKGLSKKEFQNYFKH